MPATPEDKPTLPCGAPNPATTESGTPAHNRTGDLFSHCWRLLAPPDAPAPEPELRFAPPRRWRFDFAWPDQKVAVEIHGAVWTSGRHTRGAGFSMDRMKMNTAQLRGWLCLEFTTTMLSEDPEACIGQVLEALALRESLPCSSRGGNHNA